MSEGGAPPDSPWSRTRTDRAQGGEAAQIETPSSRSSHEIDLRERVQNRMAADRARVEEAASSQIEEMGEALTTAHEHIARTWSRRLSDDLNTTSRAIKHDLDGIALTTAQIRKRAQRMAWWPIGVGALIALILIGSAAWIRFFVVEPVPPASVPTRQIIQGGSTYETIEEKGWIICKKTGQPCRELTKKER